MHHTASSNPTHKVRSTPLWPPLLRPIECNTSHLLPEQAYVNGIRALSSNMYPAVYAERSPVIFWASGQRYCNIEVKRFRSYLQQNFAWVLETTTAPPANVVGNRREPILQQSDPPPSDRWGCKVVLTTPTVSDIVLPHVAVGILCVIQRHSVE